MNLPWVSRRKYNEVQERYRESRRDYYKLWREMDEAEQTIVALRGLLDNSPRDPDGPQTDRAYSQAEILRAGGMEIK